MISSSRFAKVLFFITIFFSEESVVDDFENNIYNNHGSIGLVNMPSARFYDESSFGITFYDGTPDQKVTLTSSPFDWLEASFFYTNIQGLPYPGYEYQDYKDKGFNLKVRLKEQGVLPAVAFGINDLCLFFDDPNSPKWGSFFHVNDSTNKIHLFVDTNNFFK